MVMFEGKVHVKQTVNLTITNLDMDDVYKMLEGLRYLKKTLPEEPEAVKYLNEVLHEIAREATPATRFYFSDDENYE